MHLKKEKCYCIPETRSKSIGLFNLCPRLCQHRRLLLLTGKMHLQNENLTAMINIK